MKLLRVRFNQPPAISRALPLDAIRYVPFTMRLIDESPANDRAPEPAGQFPLPPAAMVAQLRAMLDAAQFDYSYGVDLSRADHRALFDHFGLLAHGSYDRSWPLQLGRWLYRKLCNETLALTQFTAGILQEFSGPQVKPGLCLLIDLSNLVGDWDDLAADLATLPWEALTQAEAPLEQTHAVVVARRLFQHHRETVTPRYSLYAPTRVLAVTPRYDPSRRMRPYERQARPYNPMNARHRTPFVWCDCPPVEPGLTLTQLQQALERYQPHVLHYFGHGIELKESTVDGREVFTFQFDEVDSEQSDLVSPAAFRFAVQNHHLMFLVLFACLSGTIAAVRTPDQRARSAITALAERIPSMLVLSVSMPLRAGGIAGDVLYARLADGASLLEAVYALRGALWGDAQRHTTPKTERWAWFVPVVYIRGLSSNWRFADPPEVRSQPLRPPVAGPAAEPDQDQLVDQMVVAASGARHLVIHGAPGTCRTTLLAKLYQRLSAIGGGEVFCLHPLTAFPAAPAADLQTMIHRVLAARFAQQTAQDHVHWQAAADQAIHYLTAHQAATPTSVLIDDCPANLAEQLLLQQNPAIRYVLVLDQPPHRADQRVAAFETSHLHPPPNPALDYAWYEAQLLNPLRAKKLQLLQLLLEVAIPLTIEEISAILDYEPQDLLDCINVLRTSAMRYAVSGTDTLTTSISPASWDQFPGRAFLATSIDRLLQSWCDRQWRRFHDPQDPRPLTRTMLRLLTSPRFQQRLRPIPREPIDTEQLSSAYKPWLALLRQAQRHHPDLLEPVAGLIRWRMDHGPYTQLYTALDRWMIGQIIAVVCADQEGFVPDLDAIPIDDTSIMRVSGYRTADHEALRQRLRSVVQRFLDHELHRS